MVGVAQLFYQFWPHTRLIGRLGSLDRWIQTPSNHRVHHAQNDIYLDKNYVGVFLIWDHLFGSFQEELDDEPCIYGIRGQLKSWNPVWANLHYYWAMVKDSWLCRELAGQIAGLVHASGMASGRCAARFPKPGYDLHWDFVKFCRPSASPAASRLCCCSPGLFLEQRFSGAPAEPGPGAQYDLVLGDRREPGRNRGFDGAPSLLTSLSWQSGRRLRAASRGRCRGPVSPKRWRGWLRAGPS